MILHCQNVAIDAGVGADKGVIVGINDPFWRRVRAHVEINVPVRVEGIRWLSPSANVNVRTVGFIDTEEQADVVDALLEDAVLRPGAGDVFTAKWHRCEKLRIPIADVLQKCNKTPFACRKYKETAMKCYPLHIKRLDHGGLGRAFAKFEEVPICRGHESEAEGESEHLNFVFDLFEAES